MLRNVYLLHIYNTDMILDWLYAWSSYQEANIFFGKNITHYRNKLELLIIDFSFFHQSTILCVISVDSISVMYGVIAWIISHFRITGGPGWTFSSCIHLFLYFFCYIQATRIIFRNGNLLALIFLFYCCTFNLHQLHIF